MALYFLVHDTDLFLKRIRPALAASWVQRSFRPCRAVCQELVPAFESFSRRYHLGPEEPVLRSISQGDFRFDRDFWHLLVGEILLFAAVDIPEFPTAPETLACLLGAGEDRLRPFRSAIQQAHFGVRDLTFGPAFYRPDSVGWNDPAEVVRLASALEAVDPQAWKVEDLQGQADLPTAEDRDEELEFAREWFPALVDLYRQVATHKGLVICEVLVS